MKIFCLNARNTKIGKNSTKLGFPLLPSLGYNLMMLTHSTTLPYIVYVVLRISLGSPISQETRNLGFGGVPVVKSAYKTFFGQLKFSVFFLKKNFDFRKKKI